MSSSLDTHLDIKALMEMGFTQEKVEQALKATNNRGIPDALEWLFNHPVADNDSGQRLGGESSSNATDDVLQENKEMSPGAEPMAEEPSVEQKAEEPNAGSAETAPTETAPTETALSLKCEECGKLLKGEAEATMHAARSGHSQFAESTEAIKPLTDEEKIEQRKRVQEKLEERRKQRLQDEKEQDKLREKNRRKTGQEITKAKDDHAVMEMKKIADERRREKLEEKRLKQKLKEQIAKDRENFKLKHQNQHQQPSSPSTKKPATTASPSSSPLVKKEYDTCRVQFRMPDGSTLNSNFSASDTMFTVHEFISKNRTDGACAEAFALSTTFPRKTFHDEHMLQTMKELGLVPSVVLVISKVA